MQSDNGRGSLDRRAFLRWLGSKIASNSDILLFGGLSLAIIPGCGGGGGVGPTTVSSPGTVTGPRPPPVSPPQSSNTFTVIINGRTRTIFIATPNPTVLDLTRMSSQVAMEGERVIAIDGTADSKQEGGAHWRYYRDSELVQLPASAALARSGGTIDWRFEVTGE